MSKVTLLPTATKSTQHNPAQRAEPIAALRLLIEAFGHQPDLIPVVELDDIAARLSVVAGKEPPWGWRYLRNVLNEKIDASPRLLSAVYALGAEIDGTPPLVAGAHQVMVLAVGKVDPGTIILADGRRCARPGCPVKFVPRVPRQRYCCAACRNVKRSSS